MGWRRTISCAGDDGSLFIGAVWPGESVFPDFSRADVRHWWGARHRALLEAGVAAIWDDMNEPALTDWLGGAEPFHTARYAARERAALPGWPERPARSRHDGVPQRLRHADGARDV